MPTSLITGASAGIGREFALQLARRGHDLVVVARNGDRLLDLKRLVHEQFGVACEVLPANLAHDADVERVVQRIDAAPVDVLVNNAGFGTTGRLTRASREEQDAMVRVHGLATHRLAHAAAQSMLPRGRGAIINVSSMASFVTSPGNVNYSATKAYVRFYAEGLAQELAGTGVYVQALCPGFTHTEFHERAGMNMSRYPGWWWMTAERVVSESLAEMQRGKRVVVIPGAGYRVAASLLRHMPHWMRRAITARRRTDGGRGTEDWKGGRGTGDGR